MSVSIVINNYNYAQFLEQAIQSALDQTVPAVEVIVVDDGSTDDSRAIIEGFGDNVISVFKENGGQASAFNRGIEVAQGRYIWLLDADDYLMENALETAMELVQPEVARLTLGLQNVDQEGTELGQQIPNGGHVFLGSLRDAILCEGGFPSVPTSGNLFSREALMSALPVPEERYRICADAYLFAETAKYGLLQLEPDLVAYYRIHGANNFFQSVETPESQRLFTEKNLANTLNTLEVLNRYAEILSARDRKAIRLFWLGNQALLWIAKAKKVGVVHPELREWSYGRVCWFFLQYLLLGRQALKIRLVKARELVRVLVFERIAPNP